MGAIPIVTGAIAIAEEVKPFLDKMAPTIPLFTNMVEGLIKGPQKGQTRMGLVMKWIKGIGEDLVSNGQIQSVPSDQAIQGSIQTVVSQQKAAGTLTGDLGQFNVNSAQVQGLLMILQGSTQIIQATGPVATP